MKSMILAVAVVLSLSACGPSTEQIALDRQNVRTGQELARREAIDELNHAKEQARLAGARFANDAQLIRKYQCDTRAATEKLGQVPGYKRFGIEMRQPFHDSCVREAGIVLANLQRAAKQAAQERAVAKMRLAAAAKKGSKK